MATQPLKRNLYAILAADAAGYSRIMGENEEEAFRVLRAHRAVTDSIIELHGGRVFNTAGDSVLAAFESPVEAVRAAIEIQDALKTRNLSLPENRRLTFRIGINLGDVIVKDNDLLGDAVNVAARLESQAEPGGLCISGTVYDQIVGKLDLQFQTAGELSLKNIKRPVRAYKFGGAIGTVNPAPESESRGKKKWPVPVISAAAAATAGAAVAAFFLTRDPAPTLVSKSAEPPPLAAAMPARPSVAVPSPTPMPPSASAAVPAPESTPPLASATAAQPTPAPAVAPARVEPAKRSSAAVREARPAPASPEKPTEQVRLPAAPTAPRKPPAAQTTAPSAVAAVATPRASAAASVPKYDGMWSGTWCPRATRHVEAFCVTRAVRVAGERIIGDWGEPGAPGFLRLTGSIKEDGSVELSGNGVAGQGPNRGAPVTVELQGRIHGDMLVATGKINNVRDVELNLARTQR